MRWQLIWSSLAVVGLAVVPLRADEVTFSKHVAPILYKHCAGCHRPGEIGPFPLLTYKDAAKRADFIKTVTASKRMPPWKAEPGHGEFLDARVLGDDELKTLAAWADGGAKEGDPRDLPPQPTFAEGWQLGEPDLVLKMPEPFTLPADGRDVLQCFVIPVPIDADRTVAAYEVRPGNRRVVHHAIVFLDTTGTARKLDAADPAPGYHSVIGPGFLPTGGLGAWAPGSTPHFLPEGVGKYLKKGTDVVLQIHYHPSGKEETDQSQVGIYFTKKPAEKLMGAVAIRGRFLIIPAGEKDYRVTGESEPLPCDVKAFSIFPHMHYVGREMKVTAQLPDGKTRPMIWIKDWDFNWQGAYYYKDPFTLPKGTVLKLEAVYDNSADNPRNPNHPPRLVHLGEQTTDEMCLCGVGVTTETMADLRLVARMQLGRLATLLGGGASSEILKDLKDHKDVKDLFKLNDAEGRSHDAAEWKDRKAVVLLFITTDCPVSNGYAPEYVRLAKAFGDRGVAFYGVQSDPDVSAKAQAKHAKEYGLTFPVLMDPKQGLAKATGVRVTPEAVVLSPDGKVLYRGRIDDRVSDDGKRREEPRVRDLQDALESVLAGKAPPVAETKAFGCPLPPVK